ncbi:MAG: polyprenyl diphosphate synthase [Candidatus Magasanikbacteria bacterium]|nr:polyprenyl diphosphate synthase [Candidatus Magasanikbacteria bacterium]
MSLPTHIAIIPDGNRRWAKAKGLIGSLGHKAGIEGAETLFKAAREAGVPYLTFWGCSVRNVTKRDSAEVNFLFGLFEEYFTKLLNEVNNSKSLVRVRVFGEWETYLPTSLQKILRELISKTANFTEFNLTFLLAYSGIIEMLKAISALTRLPSANTTAITEEGLKKQLYTHELPPVDLVIRTAAEPEFAHFSEGFLLWEAKDAQLAFTPTLFPDFTALELQAIIKKYGDTERRLGK